MRWLHRSFLLLLLLLTGDRMFAERWAVYYSDVLPAEDFLPFNLVVFDRERHPPLAALKAQHTVLLGYISLGEAETYRSDLYAMVQQQQWLLATPDGWKGNPVIDPRNPAWQNYVLDVLVPQTLAAGFDGVMLDTVDSLIWLEARDPARYAGLKAASAQMIHAMRQRYPGMRIMLNRGFDIVPRVAGDIDMLLAESTCSHWELHTPTATMVAPDARRHYLTLLHRFKEQSPRLKIYTLDYWPTADVRGVARIYRAQYRAGFLPYVSVPDLQSVAK